MSDTPNNHQKKADKTPSLQRRHIGGLPRLCPYCRGQGVILDGFLGYPMTCPDCNGDGIERRP